MKSCKANFYLWHEIKQAKHIGCEDNLNDKNYFNQVYKEACELTAYLCKLYNLNPTGNTSVNGVKVPVILCHYDSYKLGLGSGHMDVYHWFDKHGKTMDHVRKDVAALMKGGNVSTSTSTTKPQPSPAPSKPAQNTSSASVPHITYGVKTKAHGILPDVKDRSDFAGYANSEIVGVKIGVTSGSVKYRVHTKSGWLPYVTGCNWNDFNNGYAGDDKSAIDAIECMYYTDPSKTGGKYYRVKYQVKGKGYKSYFDNQYDTEKTNGQDGYAGAFGIPIVELLMNLE